ncbi:MAG: hypothetical protein HXK03_06010 [Schaalia georgiae]|uniref:Transmembrane protein n=1 Tax=Schaalia georgiae TaxID=52768 RepID=A0A929QXY5_9ACTO|nr:hypothetical protein [Schaalia georgiae]
MDNDRGERAKALAKYCALLVLLCVALPIFTPNIPGFALLTVLAGPLTLLPLMTWLRPLPLARADGSAQKGEQRTSVLRAAALPLVVVLVWSAIVAGSMIALRASETSFSTRVTPYHIQLSALTALAGVAWAFVLARHRVRHPENGQDDTRTAAQSGPLHDPAISLVDPLPRKEGAAPADNGRASADGAPAPLAVQASLTYRGSSASARPHSEDEERNEAT